METDKNTLQFWTHVIQLAVYECLLGQWILSKKKKLNGKSCTESYDGTEIDLTYYELNNAVSHFYWW